MNNHDLLLRQQLLLCRSQELRSSLADQVGALERPLAVVDAVQRGLKWLYARPLVPLGALTVLVVFRPRQVVRWTGRLWWAWQAWRRVRRAIRL
ncbi:YqjK-like family protein [Rhodoferax sp. 4810]|nr:YqjK-like family protein [Rhodoferax jenense]